MSYMVLEFQQWLNDYKTGRPQRPYLCVKNGNTKTWNLDLTEYVRHQIHHPENHSNTHFTQSELRQSIEDMRGYIRTRAETEGFGIPFWAMNKIAVIDCYMGKLNKVIS